jgi:predicted enzyme related to lactoylglutathione lyase
MTPEPACPLYDEIGRGEVAPRGDYRDRTSSLIEGSSGSPQAWQPFQTGICRCRSRSKARACSRKRGQSGEWRLSSSARAAKLRRQAPPRRALGKSIAEETGMAMQLGHVHIKTREDPQKVAKFYIDNFGATVKREIPGRGCQLDLHGVQLNVTTIIADQNHEQHVGIEHIAIETDDYAGALANFKKNGAQILEERVNNGRHVCWVAAPDGAQMELIEKV